MPHAQAESLNQLAENVALRFERNYAANPKHVEQTVKTVNRWLQGPVTFQGFALKSDLTTGNDELEAGVFLPFRSPEGRNLDAQQMSLSDEISALRKQRLKLVVSGLVREALWTRLTNETQLSGLTQKSEWIARFDSVIESLYAQGEISRLVYLHWQQQKLSHHLKRVEAQFATEQSINYYTQVTGTDSVPSAYNETLVTQPYNAISQHPELKLLSLSQSQIDLNLDMSGNVSVPWTLGMIARQLRGPTGNENLLGLYVNIPLPVNDSLSATNYAAWKDARDAVTEMTVETYAHLQQQLGQAMSDYQYLKEAQTLIQQQVALADEIEQYYLEQKASLPQLLWLEKLIEQQDMRIALMMNRVKRNESIARINQVAGVSL